MKKLTIELTEDAHLRLLSIQLEKKINKDERTTLVQVASDVFSEYLESLNKKDLTTKRV